MYENVRNTYGDVIWKKSLRDEENAIKICKKNFIFMNLSIEDEDGNVI